MFRCLLGLLFVLVVLNIGINAQTPANKESIESILKTRLASSFKGCGGWPPRLVKKNKRTVARPPANAPDASTELATAILKFSSTPINTIEPKLYSASHLRLLDTIGFDPNDPDARKFDSDMFDFARWTDPAEIRSWGTNHFLIRYDCFSSLSLIAKAKQDRFIPLVTLDAALEASRTSSRKDEIVIYYAYQLESPFQKAYSSNNSTRRRLAATRALSWRLTNVAVENPLYLAVASFLVFENVSNSTQTDSVTGNLKAGLRVPFVDAHVNSEGKLTGQITSDSSSYTTYFWGNKESPLPTVKDLVQVIDQSMDIPFKPEKSVISGQEMIKATAEIKGWDPALCNIRWVLKSENENFIQNRINTRQKAENGVDATTCVIDVEFFSSKGDSDSLGELKLVMIHPKDEQVKFSLSTPFRISRREAPFVQMNETTARWKSSDTDGRRYIKWDLSGEVLPRNLEQLRRIIRVRVKDHSGSCRSGESSQALSDIRLSLSANDFRFKAEALLFIDGDVEFDPNIDQAEQIYCTITGELLVTSSLLDGGDVVTDEVPFSTRNPIRFPRILTDGPTP